MGKHSEKNEDIPRDENKHARKHVRINHFILPIRHRSVDLDYGAI